LIFGREKPVSVASASVLTNWKMLESVVCAKLCLPFVVIDGWFCGPVSLFC
jgi:hypothetical protein